MADLHELTALELWQELQTGRVSPRELASHYLDRVERLNPQLGAFITVTRDAALRRADEVAERVPRTAPLWGLPSGDKDLWMRAGVPTGFGSRAMADFVPETSDEIVETLDAAGAVSLGKTNAPEFGLPAYTESLAAPPARNPWNPELGAGGSSGGAAAAVASGMLPFAPGSDGGGSVRIPAAACGLVGLKPSRGLVPAGSGIASLAGLVVDGPIARTTTDAALLLDGMIAKRSDGAIDHHYTLRAPYDDDGPFLGTAVRGEGRFQLGVMTSSAWDGAYDITIAPEAMDALVTAAEAFDSMGHGLEDAELEPDDTYAPAFRTIWQAGAARIPAEGEVLDLLEPLTAWLVERGRALSARELSEALAALTAYERSFIRQLSSFDAVLTPAMAMTPRPVGWYDQEDGERNFAQQVQYTPFTSMLNVTGLPAVVLPISQTAEGLPMGVQLIGRPGGERTLLSLATQLEHRVRWQERRPPVW
ncbi:amidase [Leifsonia shinshuensis]|uniref:amidase n=1 Tax=Leifsonia shinshuensis TaxID=150026 RepID=UPI0028595CDF|nr:amidase [Leifsonia shinshuensis]MDR6969704.1 amidase [Leifsonia shinshuensis]